MTATKDAGEDTASATTAPTPAWGRTLLWVLVSAVCFHIAHLAPYGGFALVGFFIGLLNLSRLNNAPHGFRWGVGLGWMVYTPHLLFFWHVFVPEGAGGLDAAGPPQARCLCHGLCCRDAMEMIG